MSWYVNSLFGQVAAPVKTTSSLAGLNLLVVLGVIFLSVFLGLYLGKKLRMPDHGWKIGVILFSVLASVAVLVLGQDMRLGIDLRGGVILVYQVDQKSKPANLDMDKLITAITRRVNPGGQKEVVIRKFGTDEIEILDPIDTRDPEASKAEIESLKRVISSQGSLQFRILATRRDNKDLIERALAETSKSKLTDASGQLEAWWVPVDDKQLDSVRGPDITTRVREVGKGEDKKSVTEVLVLNDEYNVTGQYLSGARDDVDNEGKPAVKFTFNTEGGQKFGDITGTHLPDKIGGQKYHLAIILDDVLYSAPTINDRIFDSGIISGRFSKAEVVGLVNILNAGSLPAALVKEPISELFSGATLGSDTITKSLHAMLIASILVPIFMLVYYRFSGLVAVIALCLNMVMLFAIMRAFHAAFTLTGFAGLALTVGMAVDNNILVFERLREERDRGATLRMAIRNAFHRAGTTIIDCNLTHMIAATVLWFLGTDQLKGFAVTLWLGVVTSMYTSVFVSHVVFEIAEKRQWISDVKMLRWIGHTNIDFMRLFPYALTASILITIAAIVVSFARGKGLFDIDFTGGVSVQAVFDSPQEPDAVRKRLEKQSAKEKLPDLVVNDVQMAGQQRGLQFLINTSESDPVKVQDELRRVFPNELAHNKFDFSDPATVSAAAPVEKTLPPAKGPEMKSAEPEKKGQTRNDLPSHAMLALAGDASLTLALADETPKTGATKATAKKVPANEAKPDAKPLATGEKTAVAPPAASPSAIPVVNAFVGGSQAVLTFKMAVNHDTLEQAIEAAMKKTGVGSATTLHEFSNPDYTEGDRVPFSKWTMKILLPPDKAKMLLREMQSQVAASPIFPASSQIGGAVANNTRILAIYALIVSWIGIIVYLWIRFQGVAFGLAAVVALVHDVFVMLGGIAVSYYVADYLGFLMIDQFKINLTIVAAFLTIIGYSVNDTIVVFDRIREVRGKDPNVTRQMVNDSVNQTLSRTLLTSFTVFLVVVVLYIAGGEAVHGFAFALLIGVATGTYSSIYIAAPILLWLVGKRHHVAAFIDRDHDR